MDARYAAGFFDGEGCITFILTADQRRPTTLRTAPWVTVGNTNRQVLESLQNWWGGRLEEAYKNERPNRKQVWRWAPGKRAEMESFLKAVLPFLIVKRQHAELMLEFLTLPRMSPRKIEIALEVRKLNASKGG